MATLVAKVLDLFRPREGWVPFLLLLIALLSLPAALFEAEENLATAGLIVLTVVAAIAGLRVARSRLQARAAAVLGGLLGLLLVMVIVGRLLPPLSLLWRELGYAVEWQKGWTQGRIGWPLPFSAAVGFVWQQVNALGLRLWWWGQTLASGAQTQDNILFLLLSGFLAWGAALFATWQVYRQRNALVGLVPSGVATAILAFFHGGMAFFYLVAYLFCTLWLQAVCHMWSDQERWERTGTDYPGNLGTELLLSLGPLLVVVLTVAALFPGLYSSLLRDSIWRLIDTPWSRAERAAEQLFGPLDSGYSTGVGPRGGPGGELPSSHLLGGRPELGQTLVLYVSTSAPPPPLPAPDQFEEPQPEAPHRYWRSRTYDTYTGLGWTNSPLESQPLPSNRTLDPDPPPGSDLFQQFQRLAPGEVLVYAANAPYRLDHPVQTWWRDPDDLAQLTGEADVYTVLSRVPEPTVTELRAASQTTSGLRPDIGQRYLALPEAIPQRVLDLADEVAGEAPTRYDRARAIELYLRRYAYNLDLPEPPDDRDLVDYFLFDLQEGYCDYYASAMVVMARAVGVPARLASGYAQGTYDHEARRWVVTEQDGHSWVEVYFDDIGWVEFEPTAGLPVLNRPGGQDLASLSLPPLPARPARWWQQVPWALAVLGGTLVLLVALVVWIWRPRPGLAAAELVRDRQGRLLRWGTRLGQPLQDGQTAHEYNQTLGATLHTRGGDARLPRARRASAEAPGEIEHLAEAFVRAQYSPEPITERESWRVRELWARLRRHLWWLWLAPGPRKEKRDNHRT